MLGTYPENTATNETNREVLATPPNADDQNALETHPNQAAPDEENNHTVSDVFCPRVVLILVDQLSKVRAQDFYPMQGKGTCVRRSVTRSHNFAFPQQENPRKVAKAAYLSDAKTKTESKDHDLD